MLKMNGVGCVSALLFLLFCLHVSLIGCKSMVDNHFSLTGFGSGVTGGGVIPEFSPLYKHVYNARDLHDALMDDSTKVIEIMNDLDLGYYEIPSDLHDAGVFEEHDEALAHPKLMQTGVSHVFIRDRNSKTGNPGLTIFSDKAATIRHCNLEIDDMENFVLRNLKFDEMYEWDDAMNGTHDLNEWDYITVRNSTYLWFDHLEFSRSYDGSLDIKPNSSHITISWVLGHGATNGTDPFFVEQYNYLEANRHMYPHYNHIRNQGITQEQIQRVMSPQKKGHLVGPEPFEAGNVDLTVTIANSAYIDWQARIPRLRAGNTHVYNMISDARVADQARQLQESLPEIPDFEFFIFSQACISTEDGAVLVENSKILEVMHPLRNDMRGAEIERRRRDDPDPYQGKIEARNVQYTYRGIDFTGTSTSEGSPLAPVPHNWEDHPFSWNGFTELPYEYLLVNLDDLDIHLLGPTGAGARDLGWEKENWLKTSY